MLALAAGYMLAEAIGGLLTGSLALLADAGHMLTDVIALSLGLFAVRLAQRSATPQRTYGYHRTEILVALAQGALLVGVALALFVEAVQRLGAPREILAGPMLAIAVGGLLVNLIGLALLARGRDARPEPARRLAARALGRARQRRRHHRRRCCCSPSVGAGPIRWRRSAIAVLIVRSSWSLLREAVLGPDGMGARARGRRGHPARSSAPCPGVIAVHDLHVWTITSGMVALSGHVVAGEDRERGKLLQEVSDLLHERFGIDHATIQIETEDFREPGGVCFP